MVDVCAGGDLRTVPLRAGRSAAARRPQRRSSARSRHQSQRADSAPKGTLKNPYKDTDAAAVKAGQQLYMNYGCSGCHGGGGGGGMCPPLTDGVWVYGGDDDTLFRLVAYGSQILQSKGYSRQATENVVGRCRRWARW